MPSINNRAATAADPSAPPRVLRQMASDSAPKVRTAVAGNPSTPIDVLKTLANDANYQVRFAVAENPSPNAAAAALQASKTDTRAAAATRDDLDESTRWSLLQDPAHEVRENLADICSDVELLTALTKDPHPLVRACAALNRHLPLAELERLANDPLAPVRAATVASRRLAPDSLTRLADDRSTGVRWEILISHAERIDLAHKLARDSDEIIAGQAQSQLDWPPADSIERRREHPQQERP